MRLDHFHLNGVKHSWSKGVVECWDEEQTGWTSYSDLDTAGDAAEVHFIFYLYSFNQVT